MKIITYVELSEKEGLLPLMDQAFHWAFHPEKFEKTIKKDPRLKEGPVGYVALENNHVMGFVGVMDLLTRNLEGEPELAGGIWGVATLPSYVQRGIATALMNEAHKYFNGKGYRFVFLCTSRAIVAHHLYRKLGYIDATYCPSAYKLLPLKRKTGTQQLELKTEKFNTEKILEIYNDFVKEKTGLVIRNKQYLETIRKRWRLRPRNFFIIQNGYIAFKEDRGIIEVLEIVATSTAIIQQLLKAVESKAKAVIRDRMVLDHRILRIYRNMGYQVHKESHDLIMAKPLKDTKFKRAYGDNFYMTNLDLF